MLLKYSILLIFFCAILNVQSQLKQTSPCAYKSDMTSEFIRDFCTITHGEPIRSCCLIAANKTFSAIDLSDANLTRIPSFNFGNFEYSVIAIDLRLNPDLELQPDDLLNLTNLYYLYLPVNMSCPGEYDAWENITDVENGTLCEHQRNLCLNKENLCPAKSSVCAPNGPNHVSCLCKPGRSGYKCLRTGTFPYPAFVIPTAVITILASALLFWTHRRHVIDK